MNIDKPLTYIKWEDPSSAASWMGQLELDDFFTDKTYIAESVGWIVREDEEAILLAATITTNEEYAGQVFRIPKSVIRSRITIPRG